MPTNEIGGHHHEVTSTPESQDLAPAASAGSQRVADRLARYGWLVLLLAVVVALVGGAVYAAMWEPRAPDAQAAVPGRDACPDPPCFDFGGEGLPGLRDLPMTISVLGYLLAVVLGLPSLLAGVWGALRGHWAAGGQRLLAFVGPVLFFVGTEIIPHLLNPCFWALTLGGAPLPELYCAYSPEWGADLADRWHLLNHALVGALPLAALYWWALRRWRPDIARGHERARRDNASDTPHPVRRAGERARERSGVSAMVWTTLSRWGGPAAAGGGLLWMPYGVFEMLPPWGVAMVYRAELGYELITDAPLFVAYSLPGTLALLLTGLGLLGLATRLGLPIGRLGRSGLMVAYAAVALAFLSLLSVALLFTPLFWAGLVFGSLFLGAATFMLGINARASGAASRWAIALIVLGIMGLFLLPLRPLVYALEWLPEAAGAAFITLFGLGWVGLGMSLGASGQEQSGAGGSARGGRA